MVSASKICDAIAATSSATDPCLLSTKFSFFEKDKPYYEIDGTIISSFFLFLCVLSTVVVASRRILRTTKPIL